MSRAQSLTPNDGPIQIGDLAQVIGCHCSANAKYLGHIFTVAGFRSGEAVCNGCHADLGKGTWPSDAEGMAWNYAKRIPPLSELGDVETKETIDA